MVGTPFALLLARRRSWLLRVIDAFVELPIVLPPVVAGVAMLMAFGRQGCWGGAGGGGNTLPFTTGGGDLRAGIWWRRPFYIRAARIGFAGVDPAYEEVSQTLGGFAPGDFLAADAAAGVAFAGYGGDAGVGAGGSEFGATIMFAGNLTGGRRRCRWR